MKNVGIDIGGTQTRIAVINQSGDIERQVNFSTHPHDPITHMLLIKQKLDNLIAKDEYQQIGVACPGPLDVKGGRILTPPNLPGWHYFELAEVLGKLTGKAIFIENDANLAAYAEATIGAGKKANIVQFVTISTGIGAGLVVNQSIFSGANGMALEVANCIVDETNTVWGKTKQGSVERICSGTGILQQALERELPIKSTADVFSLAKQGNECANELLQYTSKKTGLFLAMLQGVIDPDLIVIGGSVALHNEMYMQQVIAEMKERVYPNIREKCQIKLAERGDAAGVIGAALWAQKQNKAK